MKIKLPSISTMFPEGDRATFAEFPYIAASEYNQLRKNAIVMERALCRIAANTGVDPVGLARDVLQNKIKQS